MTGRPAAGRAGRLELLRRQAVAGRAAGLLARKARILRGEEQRLAVLADRHGRDWRARATEAATWQLRAGLLGGQRPLRLAAADTAGRAVLRIEWRAAMGVRYPDRAVLEVPPPADVLAVGSSALGRASGAHRDALDAAVRAATATAALARVRAELVATRRRLRGIEDRLIPRLADQLRRVELNLDEIEREEGIRVRWAHPERRRDGEPSVEPAGGSQETFSEAGGESQLPAG